MTKFYTSIVLLLLLGQNFAQENYSYFLYHKNCRKAEQRFLSDDIDKCFEIYLQTFDYYPFLFVRDCFTAAEIAHYSNKDSLAIEFLIKAIPFGFRKEILEDTSAKIYPHEMRELVQTKYWSKLISINDSLYQLYTSSINHSLKQKISNLIIVDQYWRRQNNTWTSRNFRKKREQIFDKVNDSHMEKLSSIFSTTGYPGAWFIGIGDSLPGQINYAAFNNANLSEITKIILFHNDSAYINHGEFLLAEVNKGHIHPRTYAMIRDFSDRHLVKPDRKEKMYFNIWWERENFSNQEFADHCEEIGCPTKQHLRLLESKLGKGYDVFWSPFR